MAESTAFPWLKHLPEDAQTEFFEEMRDAFVQMKGVSATPHQYVEFLDPFLAAWKSTAEVHADPELYAALTSDHGFDEDDFVEAERPTDCCLEMSGQCGCEDSDCCMERSVCDHAEPEGDLLEVKRPKSGVRKLCPMNIPNPNKAHSAHWCNLAAGHTGVHRSRDGHTWTEMDERRARSDVWIGTCSCRGQDADCAAKDENWAKTLKDIPRPRHGK